MEIKMRILYFRWFVFLSQNFIIYSIKIFTKTMSETAYIDELLKAEEEANNIIQNAQKER